MARRPKAKAAPKPAAKKPAPRRRTLKAPSAPVPTASESTAPGRPIFYAKAGGPPDCWRDLRVVDAKTGKQIPDVIEADSYNGWYVQVVAGGLVRPNTRRTSGVKIRIERIPGR